MSEQIDWSKAPEGAMVLLKHVRDGAYAVSESYGDEAKTWHWPDPRYSFPLTPSMWRIVAERPYTPSWSGEGLPPVGVKVLIMNPEQFAITDYGQEFVGEECTVRAVFVNDLDYRMVAVEKVGGACCCFISEMCFPIRTPEQIAEDEREAAIKEIASVINIANCMDCGTHTATAIYDAGYRKEQK